MKRNITIAIVAAALTLGMVLTGPVATSAATTKAADTYARVYTGSSSVLIGGTRYYLTVNLWRSNQTGAYHGHATGYPAGWVAIYNAAGKLVPGGNAGKRPGWFEINTGEIRQDLIQLCGQATTPADNGVPGPIVCSGIIT